MLILSIFNIEYFYFSGGGPLDEISQNAVIEIDTFKAFRQRNVPYKNGVYTVSRHPEALFYDIYSKLF